MLSSISSGTTETAEAWMKVRPRNSAASPSAPWVSNVNSAHRNDGLYHCWKSICADLCRHDEQVPSFEAELSPDSVSSLSPWGDRIGKSRSKPPPGPMPIQRRYIKRWRSAHPARTFRSSLLSGWVATVVNTFGFMWRTSDDRTVGQSGRCHWHDSGKRRQSANRDVRFAMFHIDVDCEQLTCNNVSSINLPLRDWPAKACGSQNRPAADKHPPAAL